MYNGKRLERTVKTGTKYSITVIRSMNSLREDKTQRKEAIYMTKTRRQINAFDRWMMAITFAEAGERTTALNILNQGSKEKQACDKATKRTDHRPVLRA